MAKAKVETKKIKQTRPPIVAILGHVDHGKTTLLDHIRQTHVAAKEAGGITQKIGAYQAQFQGKKLTFIDTPGHAAFAQMRSRGAAVADIVVLVVAADDSVKPQTIESIKHIQAAKVPFVVAINKTDLLGAKVEVVKAELTQHEVFVEGYGGNTPFVLLSGKTGAGVDTLLETILLLAELEELPALPDAPLMAPIIEAKLDTARGALVSVVVKTGTLHVGDTIYAGTIGVKVRAMFSDQGVSLREATPSMPVQILGFKDLPPVGELLTSTPAVAPTITAPTAPVTDSSAPTDIIVPPTIIAPPNTLNLILRADSAGSLEAIQGSLTPEINIIISGTGDLTESDILHAVPTQALVVGFAVRTPGSVKKLAEIEGVTIKTYSIIYELLEYLEKKTLKLMEPTIDEEELGKGEVIKVFDINGDHIGGTRVDSGRLEVGDTIHLVRGEITKDARVRSLRIGKDQVKKVEAGKECGVFFSPNLDIKEKDLIISYKKLQTDD